MATWGRAETGPIATYFKFYFQWSKVSHSVEGNYTTINWQWGVNIIGGGWLGTNAVKSVSGHINGSQVFGANTWSNISGSGDHQLLGGTVNIGHNSDGTKNFGISGTGWITGTGNHTCGDSWDLPAIPRQVNITGVSGTFTSDNVSANVSWAPNGNRVDLKLEAAGQNPFKRWNNLGGSSGTFTLSSTERDTLNAYIPNTNSTPLRWTIVTVINGVDTFFSYIDKSYQIVNANPIFTDFDFADTNEDVVAITGNDQVFVQGQSALTAIIDASDKMAAQKSATPNKYIFSIDGVSDDESYSTDTITQGLGAPPLSGTRELSVKAFDSRNNSTEVKKNITVIPYAKPVISATIARENGFEEQTTLTIAGTYSRVTIGGTDKNTVDTSTGVRYRYREVGGEFGSWVSVSATASDGNVSVPDVLLPLDNDTEFEFEVEIADAFGALGTSLQQLTLDKGKPILWIGADRTVGINHRPEESTPGLHIAPGDALWDLIYPVGRIYMTVNASEDPNELYGGTWVRWGAGRVPVGVDTGQSEFNSVEKTGGAKTHTLSVNEMPSHRHKIAIDTSGGWAPGSVHSITTGASGFDPGEASDRNGSYQNSNLLELTGGGAAHNNLQPYITCYMWKRTA